MNGQIASSKQVGTDLRAVRTEYLWDGLALIKRGTTEYVYEPSVTGGNPILANGKGLFNDMLGNSLGVSEKDKFTQIKRDAFGKTLENKAGSQYNMFTGKPQVEGLGYAFLFRNYRPNLGKWQTQDPLGYPDGWNNFAYVNNKVTNCIDWLGGETKETINFFWATNSATSEVIYVMQTQSWYEKNATTKTTEWRNRTLMSDWYDNAGTHWGSYKYTSQKQIEFDQWHYVMTLQSSYGGGGLDPPEFTETTSTLGTTDNCIQANATRWETVYHWYGLPVTKYQNEIIE